jgi:hypothetical protein
MILPALWLHDRNADQVQEINQLLANRRKYYLPALTKETHFIRFCSEAVVNSSPIAHLTLLHEGHIIEIGNFDIGHQLHDLPNSNQMGFVFRPSGAK